MDTAFRVNLYRMNEEKTREKILQLIQENPVITTAELAKKLKMTDKGIEWQLTKLKDQNRIARIGAANGGKWAVKNWFSIGSVEKKPSFEGFFVFGTVFLTPFGC